MKTIKKETVKKLVSPVVTALILILSIMYIPHTGAYFYATHFNQMSNLTEKYRIIQEEDGNSGFSQVYAQTINVK